MKWSYLLSQTRNASLTALLAAYTGAAFGQGPEEYSVQNPPPQAASADTSVRDALGRIGYIVRLAPAAAHNYSKQFLSDDRFQDYQKGEAVNLVRDFERQYGIEVQSMTSWTSLSFAAFLNDEQLAALRQDKRVLEIVPDQRFELSADTTAVWTDSATTGASPPNALWSKRVTQTTEIKPWGKRAVNEMGAGNARRGLVYVVDVGVGQHEDLNVVEWINTNNPTAYHCGSRPAIACTPAIMPYVVGCYSHATAVAGVIGAKTNGVGVEGVAPTVRIVSVSFTSPNLNTTDGCNRVDLVASKVQAALNWIKADITANPSSDLSVVNISANGSNFAGIIATDIRSLATPAGTYPGAFVVESAGNQFADACGYAYGPTSPSDGIMVIGAINNHGQPVVPLNGAQGFWKSIIEGDTIMAHQAGSNFGNCVEAWAPGDAIFTTMGALNRQRSDTVYNTYAYGSGTSFAAPHVAGLAAYLIQNFALATPALVEQNIRGRFSNLGSRAPTTSAFPPASPSFHDNGTGAQINMPTMNPLGTGVAKNTPYAEFVVGSACMYPKFISSAPAGCKKVDYAVNDLPFQWSGGTYGAAPGMGINNSTFSGGRSSLWLAFDSYGSGAYTCDVTTSYVIGSSVVHSGAKSYYDAGVGFYSPYIYSVACPSANITVP